MTKLKDIPLDGCERNIINENGSDTIGNVLCDRINRFLPGINKIENVQVNPRLLRRSDCHTECVTDLIKEVRRLFLFDFDVF